MKFSIIVPVYNVEKYLTECVSSILSQSYDDYELLLIDDGSTDRSASMCDELGNNNKVKVYHQTNQGLSSARNTGINHAKGEYLVFVDSDDYIDKDSLFMFDKSLSEKPDILVTRLIHKFSDFQEVRNQTIDKIFGKNSEEIVEWIFTQSQNTWPAQQYIVRTEFVRKRHLLFTEGYLHEDLDWTARLFMVDAKISVCSFPWYFHRMLREDSITTRSNSKRVLDVYELAGKFFAEYSTNSKRSKQYKLIGNRIISSMISILNQYYFCNEKEKQRIADCVGKYILIFKYSDNRKARILFFLIKTVKCKYALEIISRGQNRHRRKQKNGWKNAKAG